MDSLKKNLSYRLKEYRRLNNLSQEMAAEQFGISTIFYGEIEREKRLPSTKLLIKLCKKIGCDELQISETISEKEPVSKNTKRLLELINTYPDLTETLLPIAESLIPKS